MGFKKTISSNLFVYKGAAVFVLIMTMTLLLFPVEFSGYRNTDKLAPLWYLITETGSVLIAIAIILTIFIYLLVLFKKRRQKYKSIYLFIGMIVLIQVSMSVVSQFYAKNFFRYQRPSQLYFEQRGFIESGNQGFFTMPLEEKRKYLQKKVDNNKDSADQIYPPILESWIYESGYSFPSGHSQTSFFLGIIIALIIFKQSENKFNCLIPLLWASLVGISRVVTGFHYPVDVIAGAGLGLLSGLIVISLKWVNEIFDSPG